MKTTINDRIRIGKKITELRKEKNISQAKLSELSGVGYSHIARIELGRLSVSIDTLSKISDALGYRLDFVK